MTTQTTAGPRTVRGALRIAAAVLVTGLLAAALAATASAKPVISEFTVGTSDSRAGGHPDLAMKLRVEKPAEPEIVRDLDFKLPEGIFGNPGAIFKCLFRTSSSITAGPAPRSDS